MSIICWLFGHKPQEGVWSGAEYMKAEIFTTDGVGREHYNLWADCARCDAKYHAGRVHGPLIRKERKPNGN